MSAVVAAFDTIQAAVETVVAVRGSGLDPAALELIDAANVKMLNDAENVGLPEKPVLFMEFHAAYEATLQMGLETVREICEEFGAVSFRATTDTAERKKLWHARHHSYESMVRSHPAQRILGTDQAVPISAYPELIGFIEYRLKECGIVAYLIGHAGDGNIHISFPFATDAEYEERQRLNDEIVMKAIELGGTATGEHGVGLGKVKFLPVEHGEAVEVMRGIKQFLDPNGILNPGKIFPQDGLAH